MDQPVAQLPGAKADQHRSAGIARRPPGSKHDSAAGAGKTTLLKVVYTPQIPRLCSDTIANNVTLGAPVTEEALAQAVRSAVLEPDLETMPEGLDTRVGPRGVRLSGGQVQRLAAARMLVTGADLLVIDDLSSALDTNTERLLWDRLLSRVASMRPTVLVVSHRQRVLRRADRIVVLLRRPPQRMQQLSDGLTSARIDALLRKWLARLPHPYHSADRVAGMLYQVSILQAELSLTQVLDRPLHGRAFFEQVIRENPDLGRPDQSAVDLQPPRQQAYAIALSYPRDHRGRGAFPARRLQALAHQAIPQGRARAAHRDHHQRQLRLRHRQTAGQP